MNCKIYQDVSEFLKENEETLLKAESEHNLILGLADRLRRGLGGSENAVLFSVMRNSKPVGQAIQFGNTRPLAISMMDSASARALVEFLIEQNTPLKGVTGPLDSSQAFADSWQELTSTTPTLVMHLGVYELQRISFPVPDGRNLIPISSVSREVSTEYIRGFTRDCFPNEEDPDRLAVDMESQQRRNETLFFWKGAADIRPVSMASNSRETRNGATISLVYTPPEFRGMGHASRIVAALSDRCLKSGKKFCNLFTDLLNPTSNSIYQKIGYRKIGESKHFKLPEKGV
jgi:predicted GNAT family acetyltransferase